MYYVLLFLLYLCFSYLAWKNFNFVLCFIFLLLPTYRVQFEIFNIPFNFLSGLIWVLILIFFIKNFSAIPNIFKNIKEKLKNKDNIFYSLRRPIILILISSYIAVFVSSDYMKALGIFKSYFLESLFFFVILVSSLKDKKDIKRCIYFLQILAFLIFGLAIYQRLTGNLIFNTTDILEQNRVTTFFGYPNANGLILLPIFFLTFINLLSDKKIWLKIFNILTLILSFIVIYLAKSESAIIAIFAGLIIFAVFKIIKNKKFILISSISIIILAFLFPFVTKAPKTIDLPDAYQYNLKQKILLQDLSGQIRRQMYFETKNYLKDNIMFGAGLVGYQSKIIDYHKFDYVETFLYPHSIFLNIWVSLGLFGLVGFFWLSILFILKLVNDLSKTNFILLVTFLAIIIQGIVEVPYFKNDLSIIWWFVFAIYLINSKRNTNLSIDNY
ncbi:MAG: O-antigen ligase family protein [Patescibacteria group bacterium]|nr:O-antigen ligase family protein [Patescibacteria group bacterium]MDD4304648.1 O-antigen ligase family protein [Patescibacteria group bacterium]MDD4695711.1 O-antigen ligase family protein [Patescibacteria group bacterium]